MRFTYKFWESLRYALGTKLRLSSAYYPQNRRAAGEDYLEFGRFIESLCYKNNFHSSIDMAPFEALYCWRCRTPLCLYGSSESALLGLDVVQETTEKVKMIQEKMRASQSRQKSYHDKRRKEIKFQVADHAFLMVNLLTGVRRALKCQKLTPLFVEPFEIVEKVGVVVTPRFPSIKILKINNNQSFTT